MLLTPDDTKEILSILSDGGLFEDETFPVVAMGAVLRGGPTRARRKDADVPQRSRSRAPQVAAREDLAAIAAHGDPTLLFAWLDAARSRLQGNQALVARLDSIIGRTTGEYREDTRIAWDRPTLNILAAHFARLYPRDADQRAFMTRAELDDTRIAVDRVALVSWTAILQFANENQATERVLTIALEDFPEDRELRALRPRDLKP